MSDEAYGYGAHAIARKMIYSHETPEGQYNFERSLRQQVSALYFLESGGRQVDFARANKISQTRASQICKSARKNRKAGIV